MELQFSTSSINFDAEHRQIVSNNLNLKKGSQAFALQRITSITSDLLKM